MGTICRGGGMVIQKSWHKTGCLAGSPWPVATCAPKPLVSQLLRAWLCLQAGLPESPPPWSRRGHDPIANPAWCPSTPELSSGPRINIFSTQVSSHKGWRMTMGKADGPQSLQWHRRQQEEQTPLSRSFLCSYFSCSLSVKHRSCTSCSSSSDVYQNSCIW